ncbi:MAG: 50S ribosomal protein L11 methyltransferase [Bacteroidetes bacterium]|nr:50S ribosomal protein L11 methyltransferase [Bacteroidota bacterium]
MTRKGHFFMETYFEVTITISGQEQSSLLIAELDALGFTGFIEESTCLKAYIPAKDYSPQLLADLCKKENCQFTKAAIEPTNWNEKWESSFSPVLVGSFAIVRATFHQPVKEVEHEILINPKMSFGTGHHPTTFLMIQQMQRLDLRNKRVFDFGTGTGVLSILADKMGAMSTLAVDNDEWSIENAKENLLLNGTKGVRIEAAAYPPENDRFDLILANINRSVLLKFIPTLSRILMPNGNIIISGFLKEDQELLIEAATEANLSLVTVMHKEEWLSILFNKVGEDSPTIFQGVN